MNISEALKARKSVRAFKSTPVPRDILESVFANALQSPSNCNVQPWQTYVVSGQQLTQLTSLLTKEILSGKAPYPDIDWKVQFSAEKQERKHASANALYSSLNIQRTDKEARKAALLRNWCFFDAPHAVFFTMDKDLGLAGAVDLGIFAQSVSLGALEHNVTSCFQAALNQYPGPIKHHLSIPASSVILFGMSLGYENCNAPVNAIKTDREPLQNLVQFIG